MGGGWMIQTPVTRAPAPRRARSATELGWFWPLLGCSMRSSRHSKAMPERFDLEADSPFESEQRLTSLAVGA
jgi:hypothetical protein